MSDPENVHIQLEGHEKFSRAYNRAFWVEIIDHLLGKSTELWSFDDVRSRLRLHQEVYRGLQDVPLERIVGSVGRYHDFTNKFLPKKRNMEDRWSNIYVQFNSLVGLPPVELYQVDDVFFVRDGNHRVSVARQMGLDSLEAYVTELQTPIDLEPNMSAHEWDIADAYAKFLEQTRLDDTRPKQRRIILTEPSRYRDLLENILLYKNLLEHHRESQIELTQAAATWYDTIYLPAVEMIQKYDVLKFTPRRTEADLFLWIAEHLQQIVSEYGDDLHDLKISQLLTGFLEANNLPVPEKLYEENDQPAISG